MRERGPSFTARWIAAQRASLAGQRPAPETGDADAERRLYQGFSRAFVLPGLRPTGMAARTKFFDDETTWAIARGVDQIVIVGAGYDGRALRFGGAGVRWIEVDHPATQADKRHRLAGLGVALDHLKFVAVDLITDDLDVALGDAGQAIDRPTLFICEGLLAYLPLETSRSLCSTLRRRSHADSVLAANFRVTPLSGGSMQLLPTAVNGLLSIMGEHRRMNFHPGDVEQLFEETGWRITRDDTLDHNRLDGRSHLVVVAATPHRACREG